ncbi:MAG: hypothetical protein IJT16_14635 [Lachnospiraceae bacterium]|nr:hypothetical protein [Lachnospiraceae bacterium]
MAGENRKIKLFVPGRLCLFGEHSDWAGGYRTTNAELEPGHAIVTGLEQGIYATAYRSKDFRVINRLGENNTAGQVEANSQRETYISGENAGTGADPDKTMVADEFSCPMDFKKLRETAKEGGYFSYVAGVASYIDEWYRVDGVTIEITDMTLPMKSGLSSSAAICVLVARAFNELYDLQLNTLGIMNIAYLGEQRTPSRCGRLDQACAFGVRPVNMTFDGNEILVDRMVVGAPLYYVFADLMAHKDTVRILSDLNSGFPFARSDEDKAIQEALGVENTEINKRAVEYIASGDTKALGALMVEAQELFDRKVAPKSPDELASPVLHAALSDPEIIKLTYGRKGVGSQGDGTVQFLAKDEETQKQLMAYLKDVKGMNCYKLTLQPGSLVKKAVIPLAGFGTRLYPETRGVKKAFLPVPDRDGLLKPSILILLEELDEIGIESICLVVGKDEEQYYRDFFQNPLPMQHYEKLPKKAQAYDDKIRRIGAKITFAYQEEMLGFGHAVYQTAGFASGEPVLMLLGDTIYKSNTAEPCTKQLLHQFDLLGQSVVSVHRIPLSEVNSYGIFAGSWEDNEKTVIDLDRIFEKPTEVYASDYLGMPMDNNGEESGYYAAFGAYVITPEVYDELGEMVKEYEARRADGSVAGEVEFTEALRRVMEKQGMYAFVPQGESFDTGNVAAYMDTIARYGR